ncbi:hypothetical protein L202_02704 [Cryptococcus amylolentus CBS 6039]|uniref:Uncharacterized protein n=1 Tax=Cryptococcus amylolentus CBS 6039 TaxID=1295533 RepID=A0A1E3HVX4_9TREE|nr:hypothetical protein L202_02704 [Cryptococcus amylolentus CBS 6039]ODN80464.1 hypothetical protein L202_02704 [Cryptococcus amylolentus CBS 6039]
MPTPPPTDQAEQADTPAHDQLVMDPPHEDMEENPEEMELLSLRYRMERDRKRVKVYELRDASWFDRGTGFCRGVVDDASGEAIIVVEPEEDSPEGEEDAGGFLTRELLLHTKVERDDIYGKQQETLIVWTDPATSLDIALSFQDAEGCEDTWQFIVEVQKHLLTLPGEDPHLPSSSSPVGNSPQLGPAASHYAMADPRLAWQPPTLANIRDQEFCLRAQAKSAAGRERAMEHILNEEYIKQLINVLEQAEDLESIADLHALCSLMQTILLFNDNGIFEYILQDDIFLGVIGMLEYDPDFPDLKASYRQYFQENARFREIVHIPDAVIRNKIHQTYRLLFLKDVVLARVLDDPAFNILNGFVFFNQVDIVNYLQSSDTMLTALFAPFQSSPPGPPPADGQPGEPLDEKKRDTVMFLHQLVGIGKAIQLTPRMALYRTLLERGILHAVEWALQRPEAKVLHGAAEILTLMVEHDANMVRMHVFREEEKKERTLMVEIIGLLHTTKNGGLMGQMADTLRTLLEVPADTESFIAKKEAPLSDTFNVYFYESCGALLFKPLLESPDFKSQPNTKLARNYTTLLQNLTELLSYCVTTHGHKSSYFILSNPISKKVVGLLYIKDKPLRHAALRYLKACLRTPNHFIHRHFVKNDLFEPLLTLMEDETSKDNMMSSACMEVVEQIRKDNLKTILNYLFDSYTDRLEALARRPLLRTCLVGLKARWEMNNEPPPLPPGLSPSELAASASKTDVGEGDSWIEGEKREEDYFNGSDDDEGSSPSGPSKSEEGSVPAKRKRHPTTSSSGGSNKRTLRSSTSSSSLATSSSTGSAGPSSGVLGLDYDDASSDPESPFSQDQGGEDEDEELGTEDGAVPLTTSTSLLDRTISRAQALSPPDHSKPLTTTAPFAPVSISSTAKPDEKSSSAKEDEGMDIGEVTAKMREKRRREEEEEEEGFAGLVVGNKPRPVATVAARVSSASGGGTVGAGKGEEGTNPNMEGIVEEVDVGDGNKEGKGKSRKGVREMGNKIRLITQKFGGK